MAIQPHDVDAMSMSMSMKCDDTDKNGMQSVDGMSSMSMSSSSSSSSADSNSYYRRVERLYKFDPSIATAAVGTSTSHLKRKPGVSRAQRRAAAAAAAAAAKEMNINSNGTPSSSPLASSSSSSSLAFPTDLEWERWKEYTIDARNLDRNTAEMRAKMIEHAKPTTNLNPSPSSSSFSSPPSPSSAPSLPRWVSPNCRVYSFRDIPGFHFIANALDPVSQSWWSWRCLAGYSQAEHTNVSNLEKLKIEEAKAKEQQMREHVETNGESKTASSFFTVTPSSGSSSSSNSIPSASIWSTACSTGDFSVLSSLRWASLGFHYDWTNREYTASARSPFPNELADISREIAHTAGVEFHRPEAAIVNYYPSTGSMGAHIDDAELTKLQPIVSVSLGCSAIFLLGGPTKESRPTGFIVRSGDAVIMSGESRVCFHGVPRIIEGSFQLYQGEEYDKKETPNSLDSIDQQDEKRQKLTDHSSTSTSQSTTLPSSIDALLAHLPIISSSSGDPLIDFSQVLPISPSADLLPTRADLCHTFRFLSTARLNMNVRQVEDHAFRYEKGMTSAICRRMKLQEQIQLAKGEGNDQTVQ